MKLSCSYKKIEHRLRDIKAGEFVGEDDRRYSKLAGATGFDVLNVVHVESGILSFMSEDAKIRPVLEGPSEFGHLSVKSLFVFQAGPHTGQACIKRDPRFAIRLDTGDPVDTPLLTKVARLKQVTLTAEDE